MATRKPLRKTVNVGVNVTFTFSLDIDTAGKELTAVAQMTDYAGSVVELGTANGVSPNTNITIQLETSQLIVGEWFMEIWADYEEDYPVLVVPAAGDTFILDVQDRIGTVGVGTFDETFDETFF